MAIAPERSKLAFQKAERALLKIWHDQTAESVHNFRTTSRRLQTLLEQIVPERGRNRKKLLKMLERMRKRAGKVRDIDVQLAALRSLKIPQEPRRKTQLMHDLLELRAKHEQRLLKLLTEGRILEIRKRLKRAGKELRPERGRDPLTVAHAMLSEVVRPSQPVTEDLLHQYRTVVKRARYAAEFASKSPEATQFIAHLKRLQDAVGNWHDWLTLTQMATRRIGEINQSPLVHAIHNVTGSKFRQAVAALTVSSPLRPVAQPHPRNAVPSPSKLLRQPGSKAPTTVTQAEAAA